MAANTTPASGAHQQAADEPLRDATLALSLYVVVLLVLPSRYVIGTLGGAGAPAQVLGLVGAVWWTAHWLAQRRPDPSTRQPLRLAALAFAAVCMFSYVVAMRRPLSAEEVNQADRGLLSLVSWLGVLFVATDGLTTRDNLERLLRRVVLMVGAVAGLGLVQFLTGQSYLSYLRLPGLVESNALTDISTREGFFRPTGTSLHAIEFGVVLTMALPLALHFGVLDRGRHPVLRWGPAALIAVGLPISISRSAILGAALVLVALLPTWPRRLRRRVYVAAGSLALAMFVLLPGFLGSLLGLFTSVGNDSSARSRTDSYAIAWHFISESPLIGRGFATFMSDYRILDNQYLVTMIETGIVGVVAVIVLLGLAVVTAFRIKDAVPCGATGHENLDRQPSLGPALGSGIAVGAMSLALFDTFSFPMATGMIFLLTGCTAALPRLTR